MIRRECAAVISVCWDIARVLFMFEERAIEALFRRSEGDGVVNCSRI
jgi:hypothetical protein